MVIGGPGQQFPLFGQKMLVTEVEILMVVNVVGARVVEQGAEICIRRPLVPATKQPLQGESAESDGGQEMLGVLVVGVAGDAVVGGGALELGKEQGLTLAVMKSS